MRMHVITPAVLAAALLANTPAADAQLAFERLWTFTHGLDEAAAGQVAEIPAFDARTNTLWVAGVVGVDVLDAVSGDHIQHIDVTPWGFVNSVAIHNGLAALAVEASDDRRNPGVVLLFDTATRAPLAGRHVIEVGALPDMVTFTHDGRRILVANEGTPNAAADEEYDLDDDPPGSVSIIDVASRSVIVTAGFEGVPLVNDPRTNAGMDLEPEYIAVDPTNRLAFVTIQEANAIGVLDLHANAFLHVIGLGAKDFNAPGNEIDPNDGGGPAQFASVDVRGLYMPDGIATYRWRESTYLVMANEGDFREDNEDRVRIQNLDPAQQGQLLGRLRVAEPPSARGDYFAAGARSFSIRDAAGQLVFDSGSTLDREAASRGIYDDARSADKGVEPEGVALLQIRDRIYAFVGLERTTASAVAVFDITSPYAVAFVDMIVTDGDRAPEGLAAYRHGGEYYLAIANETPAGNATGTNTTVYRLIP